MTPNSTTRPVKLSCSQIWKLYGPDETKTGQTAETIRIAADSGRNFAALRDVSIEISEGEIFVIMGLSGSGKSTLLRCLSRLVEPTFGEVMLNGRPVTGMSATELRELRRHEIGMVFQHFALLPHLSVAENIALPLRVRGDDPKAIAEKVSEVTQLVGLAGMADRLPRQLSGGQQQRVGLARALGVKPSLLFLDEPFSALDPLIRRELQDELLKLQARLKKTMVFVTHDFSEAVRLGDRISIMKDGAIKQVGTPEEIVTDPADDYVKNFVAGVDLTRVVSCARIASPASLANYSHVIEGTRRVAEVAEILATTDEAVGVTDGAGRIIGELTSPAVLALVADRLQPGTGVAQ